MFCLNGVFDLKAALDWAKQGRKLCLWMLYSLSPDSNLWGRVVGFMSAWFIGNIANSANSGLNVTQTYALYFTVWKIEESIGIWPLCGHFQKQGWSMRGSCWVRIWVTDYNLLFLSKYHLNHVLVTKKYYERLKEDSV